MKKIVVLFLLLISFANSFCQTQTIIVVKPKNTNYMGEALKQNAEKDLEYAKIRSENAEMIKQQKEEEEKKYEDINMALQKELSTFDSIFNIGKYNDAIIEINKFINNHPEMIRGYMRRGETRFRLNDFVGTIADCNKCIAIFPKCESAFLMRAEAKEKLEDSKEALKDYDKCISLNNNNKYNDVIYDNEDIRNAYYNRGLLKEKLGKNGCSDLKQAEKLGHDNAYEMVKKYCN